MLRSLSRKLRLYAKHPLHVLPKRTTVQTDTSIAHRSIRIDKVEASRLRLLASIVANHVIVTLTERGTRLYEAVSGYGLGLTIAKLFAEQHGGQSEIGRSPDLGGFHVVAALPV